MTNSEIYAKSLEAIGVDLLKDTAKLAHQKSKRAGLGLEFYQICNAVYLRRTQLREEENERVK